MAAPKKKPSSKKKPSGQRLTQADIYRLGPQVAAVKQSTDPKTWKQMVADAHARGFTMAGYLSDSPGPLRERSKASLKEQARRIVQEAYQPAGEELNEQERRVRALADKRSADERVYEQWLATTQAKIAADARDSQRKYEDYQTGLAQQTQQGWQNAQANALQQMGSRPGTVSNPQDSTAIQGLSADANQANAQVANARAQTAALLPSVEANINNTSQQMLAAVAAMRAKREGETNKDLNAIFDGKKRLATDQAGETVKEYTRLLDNEQAKATGNREFGALTTKLEIGAEKDAAKLKLDAAKAAETRRANRAREKAAAEDRSLRRAKANDAKGEKDLNADGKVDAKDYRLKKRIDAEEKAKGEKAGGGKTTEGQRKRSGEKSERVTTIAGLLTDWHKKPLQVGEPGKKRALKPSEFRHRLRMEEASDLEIDVAEAIRKARARGEKKLPKNARDKAKRLGILDPDTLI